MKKFLILFLFILVSCQDKVSTVKNNDNIAIDGSLKDFDYQDIKGTYNGKFNGQSVTLDLKDNHSYYLALGNAVYKDQFIFIDEGGVIQLTNSKNMNLPFNYLSVEDPSLLVILNDDMTETNNFLENE